MREAAAIIKPLRFQVDQALMEYPDAAQTGFFAGISKGGFRL